MNIEILFRAEAENISYMTTVLLSKGWRRVYVEYSDRKHFGDGANQHEYMWCNDSYANEVYSEEFEEKIVSLYFTLQQAFDASSCE
jgi:hypothetical protein